MRPPPIKTLGASYSDDFLAMLNDGMPALLPKDDAKEMNEASAAAEDKGLANGDVASDADAQPRADTLELLRADSRAGAPQQSVWTSAHSARSLLQISADLLGAD